MAYLRDFFQQISELGVILPLCFFVGMIAMMMNKVAIRFQLPMLHKVTKYLTYVALGTMALFMIIVTIFMAVIVFTIFASNS